MATNAHLLLIEDNPDHRRIIANAIESRTRSLDLANSLEESRDRLKTIRYDLILLDIQLGNDNGLNFIREIRETHPTVPIIVLSSFGEDEMIVTAMKMGAHDYVSKDIGFEQRLATIVEKTLSQNALERQLEHAETRFTQLFNQARDFIFTIDLDGRIVDTNRYFSTVYGEDYKDQLHGQPFSQFLPDDIREEAMRVFTDVISGGEEPETYDIHLYDFNKQKRYLELNPSVLRDGDRIIGVMCIARDVTLFKQLKQREAEHHVMTMEEAHLTLIANMVRDFAHHINTPLATMMGHAELLQMKIEDEPAIETILKQGAFIRDFIQNMVHKIQSSSQTEIRRQDLNELIREELVLFETDPLFQKEIELNLDLSNKIPHVHMVTQHFSWAFDAFIQNAIEAMTDSTEKKLTIRTRLEGKTIRLDIEDTGRGIEPEIKKDLFKPFFTTKRDETRAKLGLGLYNAYLLMQPYGIRFDVQSEAKFTQFSWSIPVKTLAAQ